MDNNPEGFPDFDLSDWLQTIRTTYISIDADDNGCLDEEELTEWFQAIAPDMSPDEIAVKQSF